MEIHTLGIEVFVSAQYLIDMLLQYPVGLTWHKNTRKDTKIIITVVIIMFTQQNRNKYLNINIRLPPNEHYRLMSCI